MTTTRSARLFSLGDRITDCFLRSENASGSDLTADELPTPQAWLADLLARPGVRVAPLDSEVALSASYLPGQLHPDPADRLLIATARELDVPLVTRDQRILAYAAQGHLQAIAC